MLVLNCEADRNKNIATKKVLFLSENLQGILLNLEL